MKRVYFDIDTQIDFLFPTGALYVPGAELLVPTLARLNRGAGTLISTMCAHAEDDPEFLKYGPHCVIGTAGQLKPAALMNGQHIIEKQQLDLFTSPKLGPLLVELAADEYVVYGVVTELCVRFAALGLLGMGKPVRLVTDAIAPLDAQAAARFLADFASRGGELTTASQMLR